MSNQIKFKRSNVPGRIPTIDDITPGELALNTFDGKLFTNQTQGALSRIVEIGGGAAQNVLYVSKDGDDRNDGKTLGRAKLTIKSALSIATPGTTVFVKSGEYIENNPLRVPARVAIVGDSLRTVTIRPKNTTEDICWVGNGSYIFQLNFKGHVAPSAAVAFPPDGSAGYIVTSPYVQAVTSITTTGTGMRVDGSLVEGLKSMVVDAFTQYNQGGIGIHMLNRGNTQLVSVFTICCDISFLCEDGGFCSITNSNTSFGTYGLISRGTSEPLYYGTTGETTTGTQFLVKNLSQRPNVGDGVLFADYNQLTCERDAGLIADSIAFDLLYQSNTQSTFAGLRYWDRGTVQVPGQVLETTDAINYANTLTQAFIRNLPVTAQTGNTVPVPTLTITGSEYGARFVNDEYTTIVNILEKGPKADRVITGPDITVGESEYKALRLQVLGEKARLQEGVTNYLTVNFPTLEYDRATCARDMGLIIDAVVDDLALGTNYKSITAALSYINAAGGVYIPAEQLPATIAAIEYLKAEVAIIVDEDPTAVKTTNSRFDTIISIMNGGTAPATTYPSTNAFIQGVAENIQQNKEFIVAETLEFMVLNYPAYSFDTTICARDLRYVIDAICYDLVYGGNSQTIRAGQRYFNYANGDDNIQESEVLYTIAGFEFAQLTTERIAINDPVAPLQTVVTQFLGGQAATFLETQAIALSYTTLNKIIETGVVGSTGTIVPNGEPSTNADTLNNYQVLQDTKEFVIADTIAYINNTYPSLVYDSATCIRDLDRIIDSISFDMLHGGNRQAIQSGIYYYSNLEDTVIESQEVQTAGSIDFIKTLIEPIITAVPTSKTWQQDQIQVLDLPPASTSALSSITYSLDLIKDIIENGPADTVGFTREKDAINLTQSTDPEVIKAFNLLVANRDFIKAETIAYINKNWSIISEGTDTFYAVKDVEPLQLGTITATYPDLAQENAGLVAERQSLLNAKEQIQTDTIAFLAANYFDNFVFNKPKCYRDVGLILEAVLEDMVLGTNYKSVVAGLSYLRYYTSEVKDNQLTQTLASINAARDFTLERVLVEEAKTLITANFKIITDIIEFGEGSAPELIFAPNGASDIGNIDAGTVLQANKEFVQAEVIAWINANLNPFVYDEDKCARDVGYIIEGQTYDLTTGSNYWAVTNGRSYLRANASAVLQEPQKTATLDALQYVIDTVNDLITVDSNLQTVFDIVKTTEVPSISYPTSPIIDTNKVAAKEQLQANKAFIQEEIIAWINTNYTTLIYDEAKCERDIGYIVDAISYDIMFNSNFRSIVSGLAYYRANAADVVGTQKVATLSALNELKTVIASVVSADSTAVSRANANMDIIINIFDLGPSAAPAYNLPNPTNITLGTLNAKAQIENNKNFIVAEIVAYINDTFTGFIYDAAVQAKCERDLSLIIDAANYDTILGTNYNAVTAGLAYQRNNAAVVQESQRFQTIAGIEFVQDRLNNGIASPVALTRFNAAFNEVVDIIKNNTPNTLTFNAPVGTNANLVSANINLQTNKATLQSQLVDWIDNNFVGFVYDIATQSKCERDLGIIIDALKFDAALGTNYNAVVSGLGYQRANASNVQGSQLIQTVEGIKYARDLTVGFVAAPSQSAVTASFNEVVDIILNNTPDTLVFGETGISTNRIAAKNALITNKNVIQSQVITYISINYPALVYDQAKCIRDVGYIIDGLCYDIMYGGNSGSIRNADAYFVGTTGQLGTGEKQATIDAYEQLKSFVIDVIPDISLHSTAGDLIDIIRVHISNDGSTDLASITIQPLIVETNFTNLIANKAQIISDTSTFITTSFSNFTYDSVACSRDVGYIIDALSHDILYGGNWGIVRNAEAYFLDATSQLGAGEEYITLLSYTELQRLISELVPAYSAELTALIEIIKTVISEGNLNSLPAIVYPDVTGAPQSLFDEFENIENVKTLVIQDTSTFITNTFTNFTYDSVKCARDVGYIVDALLYDLTYQGNLESLVAARSYYVGAIAQFGTNEKIATLEAYRYLGEIVAKIAQAITITPTIGNAIIQDTSANSGNTAAALFLAARVNDIYTGIENNGVLPAVIQPNLTWVAASLVTAYNTLQSSKASIKSNIITFINENFAGFTYNQVKCREDVGYIIDAVTHDVLYGGNLASRNAAQAYFVGAISQLGVGETSATIAAYNRLIAILGDITQGISITVTPGNTETQTNAGVNATATEATEIDDLINIIIDVINNNNLSSLPTAEFPTAVNTSESYTTSIQKLQTEIETIKAGTITFVNTQNRLIYDEALCRRDIGLILDAITYDLVFNTNFRSVKVGQSYLRSYATEVTKNPQRKAILNAIEVIEKEIISIANPEANEEIYLKARLQDIRNIITTLDGDIEFTLPAPSFRAEEFYTVTLLGNNIDFLVYEVEAYIKNNYPKLKYDIDACRRDVRFIVDAIRYDITYGGNSQTINAGQAYYSANVLYLGSGEKVATLMAFAYLKTLVRNVCLSTLVTPLQNIITQTTGVFSYADIAEDAATLVETVRTILNAVDPVPETVNPSFNWTTTQKSAVKASIDEQKNTIQNAVIDDINSRIYFVYKEESCARDVGYIIDAITYDLVYDGNSQTIKAALSYYDGLGKSVVASEQNETVSALNHMKTVVQQIIKNIPVTPSADNTEIQNTLLSPGSNLSVFKTGDLIDIIVNTVKDGVARMPAEILPDFTQTDETLNSVRQNILGEKASLQAKTIDYIESRLLTFNKATCSRDVGLIIDAVSYDMVFDSNFQSITAGNSYLRASASVVKQFQLGPTIASIDFIKDACILIVAVNPTAVSRVARKFELIKQILVDGEPFSGEIVYPPPIGVSQGTLDAIAQIQSNRDFIIEEVFEYIDKNYNFLYDQDKCSRDVGLILNAVLDDIIFGTNYRTVTASLSYLRSYAGTVTSQQKQKTILGINKSRDLAIAAINDPTTQQLITDLYKIVTDVIEAVDASAAPAIVFADPINVDATVIAAANLLQTNKETLKTSVITWINDTFTGFIYTDVIQEKCERDLDYIIDASRIDAALGTNYNAVTAGLAYQRANSAYVLTDQKEQTVAALEFAKKQTQNIASSTPIKNAVVAAFDQVIEGLVGETAPSIIFPAPTGVDQNLVYAKDQLVANKDFIKAEIVSWINDNLVGFTYDAAIQAKCERDLGIIIDSANYDAALGTNYNAVTAGLAYQRENAAVVQEAQQIQTVDAIRYAQTQAETIVTDSVSGPRITTAFEEVVDIIKNNTPDALVFSTPTGASTTLYAKDQLVANKEFIKAEIIAYINFVYPAFVYDNAKCSRDVGYIVDALCYDVLYGGNSAAVKNADAYFVGASSQLGAGETAITLDAYIRLANISSQIVRGISVTKTSGNIETQTILGDVAGATEGNTVIDLVNIIRTHISNNGTTDLNAIRVNPSITWTSPTIQADFASLVAATPTIVSDTSTYITTVFDNFVYDSIKCSRDVGYIVDALCHDVLYGGNYASVRVAESYFVGAVSQLGTNESVPTVYAYERLQEIVGEIVQGISVTTSPGTTSIAVQTILSSNATGAEVTTLVGLIEITKSVIQEGNLINLEAIVYPDVSWTVTSTEDDFDAIGAAKSTIITDTSRYIARTFSNFVYDQDKCYRDVGYIVDAVAWDMLFNSNFRSVTAGNSYYRANAADVLGAQKEQTLLALQRLKTLISVNVDTDATAKARAEALMDIIISIFDTGVSPAITIPDPTNITSDTILSRDTLAAEKADIQSQVITYINDKFVAFDYSGTVQTTCERDLGIIVDAASYDLAIGTNYNAVTAGNAYRRANANVVYESQLPQTIEGIRYAQTLSTDTTAVDTSVIATFAEVINSLEGGNASAITYPDAAATADQIAAKDVLQTNRTAIANALISWIDDNFVGFTYDAGVQAKCERDLGYIIDAAQYDAVFGTNYNAVTAGLAYQRENAALVEQDQLIQTVEGIKYARDLTLAEMLDATGINRATSAFNKVIDLLQNLPSSTLLLFPSPVGVDPALEAAKNTLVLNRTNIQNDVISYITTTYPAFVYDQAKCNRDVGYIVDALCYDVLYGGNTAAIRNADAYFVGATSQLGAGETAVTLDAYEQLKTIVSGYIANAALDATTNGLIEIIRAHINNGGTTDFGAIQVLPDITWTSAALQTDFANVDTEQATIISSTSTFITNNFSNFTYNSSACSRDVGYIVDALCYDIMYGGNSAAVRNAEAYFVGAASQLGAGEQYVTVLSYDKLIADINALVLTATEQTRVEELVGIIRDVISAGNLTGLPPVVYPTVSDADFTALQNAKATIIADTSAWIIATFNNFTYDSTTCSRDVGYLIDALVYDITYQGNLATLDAARSYYVGTSAQYGTRERVPTIYAYKHMKNVVGTKLAEVSLISVFEQARLDDVVYTLENDGTLPAAIEPDTSWVDADIVASYVELIENRTAIQEGIIDYVNEKFSGFQYNQVKCARDVGYVVDALTYDLLYGGNSQIYSAALTYYLGVASIIPNQEPQTAGAYNYLKSEINALVSATSTAAANTLDSLVDILVDFVEDGATTATSIAPTYENGENFVAQNQYRLTILAREQVIKDAVILFLGTGRYDVTRCRRDTGYILNAIVYDLMYQGNSQTKHAAQTYFDGGKLQNKEDEKQATVAAYNYLDLVLRKVVQANYVRQLQTVYQQNVDLTPATEVEVGRVAELCDVLTDIIDNGYTCLVTLDAKFNLSVPINTTMSFHQLSIISASGHTFEWVGAGTDINAALPYQGGVPISENQTIAERGGVIYFTSTDQNGDFKIGTDLTIERDSGNIVGRSFSKSLLAVITPYILALEGG